MVIIDGNNIMGQKVGWHRDRPAARKELIQAVGRIALQLREPHILVFDHSSDSDAAEVEAGPLLSIHYACRDSCADVRILELAYRHGEDAEVFVVTSDRALARQAEALGARIVRSGAFRRQLKL